MKKLLVALGLFIVIATLVGAQVRPTNDAGIEGARKALIGSGIAVILQFLLFLLIGVGLYAYYQARDFASPDAIFPSFIVDVMPPGLTGLVVAGILAAAMGIIGGLMPAIRAVRMKVVDALREV